MARNYALSIAAFDRAAGSRLGVPRFAVETPARLLRVEHHVRGSDPLLCEFTVQFELTLDEVHKVLEFLSLLLDPVFDDHDVVDGLVDQSAVERQVVLAWMALSLNQVAGDPRSPRSFTHAGRPDRRCARCAACFGRLRVALPASLCRS